MGGFMSGLFTGANPTLNNDINQSGQIAGFATGVGENDVTAASNFENSLLSGDQSKIGELLAPQTGAMRKQAEQAKATTGQFGTRGGGTDASMQSVDDKTRGQVNDLIAQLTGGAAGSLANIGTTEQGIGLGANAQQEQESETKQKEQADSIFGRGLTQDFSTLNTMGTSV